MIGMKYSSLFTTVNAILIHILICITWIRRGLLRMLDEKVSAIPALQRDGRAQG